MSITFEDVGEERAVRASATAVSEVRRSASSRSVKAEDRISLAAASVALLTADGGLGGQAVREQQVCQSRGQDLFGCRVRGFAHRGVHVGDQLEVIAERLLTVKALPVAHAVDVAAHRSRHSVDPGRPRGLQPGWFQ
ncbi:hypothetical protein ASG92_13855 [Arthrobacter sp. Soil736]|nr:hypothetical protein ASG92_13855 [Arthrobacter sp. Soil736]